MPDRVLFVDDEPAVLAGMERLFRYDAVSAAPSAAPPFAVAVAPDGPAALQLLRDDGPFAVVVADLRMPGMDGVQLLQEARDASPDTVRMMLTGQGDLATAMDAVNRGAIFRFLMKPCPHEVLVTAVEAGIRQYQLVRAERQLLDQTLAGVVQVLTEVLALVNPGAASRAIRLRQIAAHIVRRLNLAHGWEIEMAALLSQLGHLAIGVDGAGAHGTLVALDPRRRQDAPAEAARDLIAHIPRLEQVAAIVAAQNGPCDQAAAGAPITGDDRVRLGGQVLCVALGFDARLCGGLNREDALDRLRLHPQQYDPVIVDALADLALPDVAWIPRRVSIGDLRTGMVLDQDVRNESGLLLVARGHEVTLPVLIRLKSLVATGAIGTQLQVLTRGE